VKKSQKDWQYIANQLGIDLEVVDDLIYTLKDHDENLSLKIIKQIDDQKKAISLLVRCMDYIS